MHPLLFRDFALRLERLAADEIIASLSSDYAVERSFGTEVLDHTSEAVDLSRAADGLPLLVNHDPNQVVGAVQNIRLAAGKLRGRLVFGASQRARELEADVRAGLWRNVSLGYSHDETRADPATGHVHVTRWTPMEASLVPIPADPTVGVGRSHPLITENRPMPDSSLPAASPALATARDPVAAERERAVEITAIGAQFKLEERARAAVQQGLAIEAFRAEALAAIAARTPEPTKFAATDSLFGSAIVGLSAREIANYSIVRAIAAISLGKPEAAGLEMAASDALVHRRGKASRGFLVPPEIWVRTVTKTAAGGLIGTDHAAGSFVELLRNSALVGQLGATILTGLQGDVEIPRRTGTTTAAWIAEDAALSSTDSTYDKISLVPKTVGALTKYTRKMLLQSSPEIEQLTRNDLMSVIAVELDRVAINGSGSGAEPTGILNTSGVNSVALGTNGLAPTYQSVVDMEREVAIDNADVGQLAFLTNAKVRGKLRTVEKSGTNAVFVWEDRLGAMAAILGYPAGVSGNVPSNLTKGTSSGICSAIIFGNWRDLVIGTWSVIEVEVNPWSSGDFEKGTVVVRALQDVDIKLRHPESFCWIKDALTT